jgi:hypothetical protein
MTVDEMNARLSQFGQQATDLTDILTQIGSEITGQIKRAAPVDTGALRSSISFNVSMNSLELEMLNYGVFQNYGVKGTENDPGAIATPDGIFGVAAGYKFQFKSQTIGGSLPFPVRRSIAQRGLKPKQFFNLRDITDEVVERLTEELIRPI